MISPEVRKALRELTLQLQTDQNSDGLAENAGDCWAELIGEVIEITRQNTGAETLKSAPNRRFMRKDEIITRAFRSLGFDMQDLGLDF